MMATRGASAFSPLTRDPHARLYVWRGDERRRGRSAVGQFALRCPCSARPTSRSSCWYARGHPQGPGRSQHPAASRCRDQGARFAPPLIARARHGSAGRCALVSTVRRPAVGRGSIPLSRPAAHHDGSVLGAAADDADHLRPRRRGCARRELGELRTEKAGRVGAEPGRQSARRRAPRLAQRHVRGAPRHTEQRGGGRESDAFEAGRKTRPPVASSRGGVAQTM
jgi:hypothetical protein